MKPRRDRSGALVNPMMSDASSNCLGSTVIFLPPVERLCSRITPRCDDYCIAAAARGGHLGGFRLGSVGSPRGPLTCPCGDPVHMTKPQSLRRKFRVNA